MVWLIGLIAIVAICIGTLIYFQKKIWNDIIDFALVHGNVPKTYGQQTFNLKGLNRCLKQLNAQDILVFLQEKNISLKERYGYTLSFAYYLTLIENHHVKKIEIAENEYSQCFDEIKTNLNNPSISKKDFLDELFKLKCLALEDYKSAEYLGDLYSNGEFLPINYKLAFQWYSASTGLGKNDSTVVKAHHLLMNHLDQCEGDENLFIRDYYLELFKRNPYVENWDQ